MGALSDLLEQPAAAATPATPATQSFASVRSITRVAESQESQGVAPELRARLLTLAEREGHAPAIVHRLHAEDGTACVDLSDNELRAYLRALDRGAVMDAGKVPDGYTQPAHCGGCGPVWLWEGVPSRVVACPWCFRRKAGKSLPRPQVTCRDCIHYLPDPLNPQAGKSGCALGAARAYWPMRTHRCGEHEPGSNGAKRADDLLISDSVEVQP